MNVTRHNKRKTGAAFSRAAQNYDQAAVLQRRIAEQMLERLEYIRLAPEWGVDIGAGTGHSSVALAKHYPNARIVSLDLATGMLQQARKHAPKWFRLRGRQQFMCGDAEILPLKTASVDLLFSNLALQWCSPELAFREFRRVLKPGGFLLFSTFGPDTLKELRQSWAEVDNLTHVNEFVDMHDLGDALLKQQFSDPVMDMEMLTLTYSSVRSLLKDLKAIGANSVIATPEQQNPGLLGKQKWQALQTAYESFRTDAMLPASYEVLFGHAWVGNMPWQEKHNNGAEVHVSMQSLSATVGTQKGGAS